MTCPCCGGLCDYYQWPCVRLTFADFVIDDDYAENCKECEYLNSLSVVLKQTAGDPCVYTKTISCGSCIDNQSDIVFTFTATATTRTLTVYKLYALDLQASVAAVNTTDAVIFNAASFTVFSGCDPAGTATVQFAPCGEKPIAPCRGTVFNGATAQFDRWPLSILLTPQNFVDVYQGTKANETELARDAPCEVNDQGIFLGGHQGAAWHGVAMYSNTSPAVLSRVSANCSGATYEGNSLVCDGITVYDGVDQPVTYVERPWQVSVSRCPADITKYYLNITGVPISGRNAAAAAFHLECSGQDCLNADCGNQNQVFVDGYLDPGGPGQDSYVSGDIDTIAGAGRVSTNCCPDEFFNRVYPIVARFFGDNPEQYDAGTYLLFQSNANGVYTLWLQDGGAGQIGVKLQVIE